MGGVRGRWGSNPFSFPMAKLKRRKGTCSNPTELEAEMEPDHLPPHRGW